MELVFRKTKIGQNCQETTRMRYIIVSWGYECPAFNTPMGTTPPTLSTQEPERMKRPRPIHGWRPTPAGFVATCIVATGVLLCPDLLWAQGRGDSIPSLAYYAAFHDFYEGEYVDALDEFRREWRSGVRVDSICYHAMMGECYYHMGELGQALDEYNSAVRIYLTVPRWLERVQFSPNIAPAGPAVAPWGPSSQAGQLGRFREAESVGQGRLNNTQQIQEGGLVQLPMLIPVHVKEIVRCTALAIRRRNELLGPLAKYDSATSDLITVLSGNVTLPNHWSQAWVDVQHGLALIGGGKENDAIPVLTRGILAAGQFQHPLTAVALLELGRLALWRGDYPTAMQLFQNASVAAYNHFDGQIIEESLRLATVAHLAANQPGVCAPLAPAIQWAKVKGHEQIQASLLVSSAENLAARGQTTEAVAMLKQAQLKMLRKSMRDGHVGARLTYLRATVSFQQKAIAEGDALLGTAMTYMRRGSLWLHHIRTLERLYANGSISDREAMDLYGILLRDPLPVDWTLRPMESLSVLVTPHSGAMERWFRIALDRKREHERSLEIADLIRRHRFFSSLAFGGRLQSLRWILEAPEQALDRQTLLNRQNLLAQYPAYGVLSRDVRRIRAALEALPLVSADSKGFAQQRRGLEQLGALSLQQEAILREIAVRRNHARLVFPPVRSTPEIEEALIPGQAILSFVWAGGDLFGFLMNRERYSYWPVQNAAALPRKISAMLRQMGHYDQNRELTVSDLADQEWKQTAGNLLAHLMEGANADFTGGFSELVIVPDGVLWYLPFEVLQVNINGELHPLIDRFRIRYAPTVSLAVPGADRRGRSPTAETAVVLGRLHPRDDEEVSRAAYENLAKAVQRTVPLSKPPLPASSALYGSLIGQLIVWDDLQPPAKGPYSWTPVQIERGKPGNTLGDWLALPFGAPDVIILPGYHTAAENSLKQVGSAAPGAEIFQTVCGLMAAGTKTILIGRWRTGGRSSLDLIREFAQELPYTSASDAWQRAVLLVTRSRLDIAAEPRIKEASDVEAIRGSHPFFWGGLMLVDSGEAPQSLEKEPKAEEPVLKVTAAAEAKMQNLGNPEKPEPDAP
jgi:CHAT domain-containing protein